MEFDIIINNKFRVKTRKSNLPLRIQTGIPWHCYADPEYILFFFRFERLSTTQKIGGNLFTDAATSSWSTDANLPYTKTLQCAGLIPPYLGIIFDPKYTVLR